MPDVADTSALPAPCAGCARLAAGPTVTLLSGAVCCSWCPAWLAETRARQDEAYAVLRLADRDARRAHLVRLEARHGAEYRRRLEAVVMQTWERRRAANSGARDA